LKPPTDCKVYLQLVKKYWEIWHLGAPGEERARQL
jgi:hypothetical protein